MKYICSFCSVILLFLCSSIVMGGENLAGGSEARGASEEVGIKKDSPDLLKNLVEEVHLKRENGEKVKNVLKTKGSKRFWVEMGIGTGFYVVSTLIVALLVEPMVSKENKSADLNVISPIMLLTMAAGTGAGVHLGGYLMDNMGRGWAPYAGAMVGGVLCVGVELMGHALGRSALKTNRAIAYSSSIFFMLGGAILGAELSHKFEYENKIRDSYMVLPSVSLGKDYQGLGLQVIF